MNNTLITIVAPSHNEPRHLCPFVESMLAQKDTSWKAIIFNNGPSTDMKEWIEGYKDSRLVYEESITDTGSWGTVNRQTAITHLVDTPYIINSSIQDYYLPNTIGELNNIINNSSPDMITWQAINHLFRYSVLTGEVAFGHLDWGQFCVKTEHIRKTGIVAKEQFTADWQTVQTMIKEGYIRSVQKLDKILTIHN